MSAADCKRKRRQAVNGYRHLGPKKRPNYKKRDASISAKRLAERVAKERAMMNRTKKK